MYTPGAGTSLSAGTHALSAAFSPEDAANYTDAAIQTTIAVSKAATSVSWAEPSGIVYGTPLGESQLNATGSVPGTFSYAPAAGTIPGAGAQTLTTTFTPDDAANYRGSTATVTLAVAKATTSASWPEPSGIVYGTPLGASQLNAVATVPGTFVYTPAAGTTLSAGTHALSAAFTPEDAANYSNSTIETTIAVAKATTSVSWPEPPGIVYGTPLGASQLNATASVPGTFSYAPAAGAVLDAGVQTLTATFTPDDTANYSGSTATVTVTVAKETTSVSWPQPPGIVVRHAARREPVECDGERSRNVQLRAGRRGRSRCRRADADRDVHAGRHGELQRLDCDRHRCRREGDDIGLVAAAAGDRRTARRSARAS